MGILNVTPDSFYQGHLEKSIAELMELTGQMLAAGAGIIDVGGQSTRPGSERLPNTEEQVRVLPVIEAIVKNFPDALISIDTYYSSVARAALNAGAHMVNDISAGEMDGEMIATVAAAKVPFVCMHMKGEPGTMHQQPAYDDVVKEVLDFFIRKINECKAAGIHDVIIDPGFGFGKTIAHNFSLLKALDVFKMLERPILAGLSRKSTIYKTLGITADEALNGTTVLNTIALTKGAHILRVHDVKEAIETVQLLNACRQAG